MKPRFLACAGCLLLAATAAADTVTHQFGGTQPSRSAAVDNDGGQSGRFRMFLNGVDQFGEGNLILWNGLFNVDGREDDDFRNSGSAIVLSRPIAALPQVEISGSVAGTLTPVQFADVAGAFTVEQNTFVSDDHQFVIYQWTIANVFGQRLPAKALFLIDWDLNDSEDDVAVGWDPGRRLAWQQDGPANSDNNHTTGGIALLAGSLDNHHLGNCCDLRSDDTTQDLYFQSVGVGNTDSGDPDKEVGVSANLGNLDNGSSRCVVFVQAIAQGASSNEGLANLQAQVDAARLLWGQVPGSDSCVFAINSGLNDAWYNPDTPGQGFFVNVFPELGLVFLAWFTYDTERPPQGTPAILGEPGHRWLTALGAFTGNRATLDVELTQGGVFDAGNPPVMQSAGYGTITLEFHDCASGTLTYEIPSLGLSGSIPIERIVPTNIPLCQQLNALALAQ